ncbi:MAG: Na(+)-translocating NADH-quinone reductase subunit A [Bacteroidota bacterium]
MKNWIYKSAFLSAFIFISYAADAQGSGGSSMSVGIMVFLFILLIGGVIFVADNLLAIESKRLGVDDKGANYGLFPGLREIFTPKVPEYATGKSVSLTKGHDIRLLGKAEATIDEDAKPTTFAVKPKDFVGMSPIPKIEVQEGDEVKAGDILFFDKKRPEIKYAAPVSGEVARITRGEKRSINEVVILSDKKMKYRKFGKFDYENATREEIVDRLVESGLWPFLRQRPFNTVPEPSEVPRDIFISTFDSAPLAPDLNMVVEGREAAFQACLDLLNKLTTGKVHLGLDARGEEKPSPAFCEAKGVEGIWFKGPHPSGNVGVQIHHIAPVNKGETVWTLGVQEAITIGNFVLNNQYEAERVVVLTGNEVKSPRYFRTHLGANVDAFLKDNLKNDNVRVISGDVLSGKKIEVDGHLSFYDDQITVVEEGDKHEMFGWLLPLSPRPSISGTFPKFKDFDYEVNTNTHGEPRAFVVTGQYESVLPMDIYPQHLFKAILVNDFERMEGLGLYELAREDVALCEFACTSKQPLQDILDRGLEALRLG